MNAEMVIFYVLQVCLTKVKRLPPAATSRAWLSKIILAYIALTKYLLHNLGALVKPGSKLITLAPVSFSKQAIRIFSTINVLNYSEFILQNRTKYFATG